MGQRRPGDLPGDLDDVATRVNAVERVIGNQPEILIPTLVNGWIAMTGFQAPRFYRVANMITGVCVLDSTAAINTGPLTLPVGWRPTATVAAPISYYNGSARVLGTTYITSLGVMNVYSNVDLFLAATYWTINITYSTVV